MSGPLSAKTAGVRSFFRGRKISSITRFFSSDNVSSLKNPPAKRLYPAPFPAVDESQPSQQPPEPTNSLECAEDVDSANALAAVSRNSSSAPYKNPTKRHWLVSTQSLILKRLPEPLIEDPSCMAVLDIAFATIATRAAHKDDTEHRVRLCEEKLGSLRRELSKADQDLHEIKDIVITLRGLLEHSDRDAEALDGVDPEEDFSAQADRLIRTAATVVGIPTDIGLKSHSTRSSVSSDSHG